MKISSFLPVTALLLSACHSADISIVVAGRVTNPAGGPAIGLLGSLCAEIKTPNGQAESTCNDLVTDVNGNYTIDLSRTISRYVTSSLEIQSATLTFVDGGEVTMTKTLDPKKIEAKDTIVLNIRDLQAYTWGQGGKVLEIIKRAQAAYSTTVRDEILDEYADLYLTELNPLEIMHIAQTMSATTTRDAVLQRYARAMFRRGRLDNRSAIRIAKAAYSTTVRDSILQLGSKCPQS